MCCYTVPHADTLQVWKNGFNMASPWGESNGNEQTPKVCVRASHSFRCFQCTLDTLTVSASVLCVRCLLCVCVCVHHALHQPMLALEQAGQLPGTVRLTGCPIPLPKLPLPSIPTQCSHV